MRRLPLFSRFGPWFFSACFASGWWLLATTPSRGQVNPDQLADQILTSARKAYNEQNLPFAATRFREFLQKFGGHANATHARYGLGLCLLDGPERDLEKAIEPLTQAANNTQFSEHPFALYYLGIAYRGIGLRDLHDAAGKPNEAAQLQARAEGRFQEAARQFESAAKVFVAKLAAVDATGKNAPREVDWLARARSDQAEMELRTKRVKEARATAEPVAKDPLFAGSQYRKLALYYHGFASFLLGDYLVAGRSLNQVAPFTDPVFGTHAHYLLGRVYEISNERAEAAAAYEGVLADYEKNRKEAVESLKHPEQFKNRRDEHERLEALVRTPPEYVAGAIFHLACLQYEAGRFADALSRFQQFAKENSRSALMPDCTLRIGFCQYQLKQLDEAVKTLQPLVGSEPRLVDQALLWLGKAQCGQALAVEPEKVGERNNRFNVAMASLKTAADRAGQVVNTDPAAKQRRGEALLELSDTQQFAKQSREAAATIEQVLNEKLLPERTEELTQRLAAALHLASDYARSDQVCTQFQKDFPKSTLLQHVLFRMAENAYFVALAAEKNANPSSRGPEVARLFEEAAKRYRLILEKFPEFERVNYARYGLGMTYLHRGEFDKAQEIFETIPGPERAGDLGATPYILAECLLRQAPAKADDALAAGMLGEKLQQAQQHLEGFIAANPQAPETPDALLKLGYCQQRLATQNADPQQRNTLLQTARQTYEKLVQQFPREPQAAAAVLERAKCLAAAGDKNGAINDLKRFAEDATLQQSAAAPTAILNLATLLREQNHAEEAAKIVAAARQRYEPHLGKEPELVALLRYHHGVCLQEAGKFNEARQELDAVPALVPQNALAAEAALRSGQCRVQEARKMIDAARQQLANAAGRADQQAAANNVLNSAHNTMNEAGQTLQRRADELRQALPTAEARARMYYDAAWAYRAVAEHELEQARSAKQIELQRKLQEEINKKTPPGTKPALAPLPEVSFLEVPVPPAETRARAVYQQLIDSFADLELALEARFELAELFAEREEMEPAIKLLRQALDKEPTDRAPPAELLDKVRIRLGTCLVLKKDPEGALAQFEAVAGNPKSPLVAQAQLRVGECVLDRGDFARAVDCLKVFREKAEFQNVPGVSDRALLRLGDAHSRAKQWEPARQAFETLIGRFGNSPWVDEARYGIGWAYQNAGQYDQGVDAYNQVVAHTTSELAAKAHLQIGLCRMEQKRWGDAAASLLIVPFTYDYPDLSVVALCEAARALTEEKKPAQAERLLRRVLKDYPQSDWAKIAQERLDKLGGSQ